MPTTTPFDRAYAFLRKWEGGDTQPGPGDPNPTSRGITQAFYDGMAVKQGWRPQSVFDLTEEQVRLTYLALWHETLCGTLPDPLGVVHYDALVNMLPWDATRLLQRAVGAEDDGVFGRQTAAAATAVADRREAARRLLALRRAFYRDLAASKPEKARFLRGWLNRVDDLERSLG